MWYGVENIHYPCTGYIQLYFTTTWQRGLVDISASIHTLVCPSPPPQLGIISSWLIYEYWDLEHFPAINTSIVHNFYETAKKNNFPIL